MFPAQIPGGPELLIIALILLVFLVIFGGILGGIVYLVRRPSGLSPEERRIEELESRVAALESARDSPRESSEADRPGREEP